MSAHRRVRDVLLVTDEGPGVCVLTFDRPDSLNAFNHIAYDALRDTVAELGEDPEVSVLVLTGAGRAFTAGQDLAELAAPPVHTDGRPHGFRPFMDVFQRCPKPVIAAVNGMAVGVGVTMLLHCDLVLLSDEARLRLPFVSLGVSPEAGSSMLLPELVGWQRAAEMLLTAPWIDAATAVERGLALERVEPGKLMDRALELAGQIASMPLASVVATKRLMLHARASRLAEARAVEDQVLAALAGGPAAQEAVAAMREKRQPRHREIPFVDAWSGVDAITS